MVRQKFKIETNIWSTGYRVYTTENSISDILTTWIDKRCIICGKFISKFKRKYCELHSVGSKEYFLLNKEKYHKWNKNYREANHDRELRRHREWYHNH